MFGVWHENFVIHIFTNFEEHIMSPTVNSFDEHDLKYTYRESLPLFFIN